MILESFYSNHNYDQKSTALQIDSDEVLICIAHFHKDCFNTFGIPILIKVKTGERFLDIKERIQKAMDITTPTFDTYKVAVVMGGQASAVD